MNITRLLTRPVKKAAALKAIQSPIGRKTAREEKAR